MKIVLSITCQNHNCLQHIRNDDNCYKEEECDRDPRSFYTATDWESLTLGKFAPILERNFITFKVLMSCQQYIFSREAVYCCLNKLTTALLFFVQEGNFHFKATSHIDFALFAKTKSIELISPWSFQTCCLTKAVYSLR